MGIGEGVVLLRGEGEEPAAVWEESHQGTATQAGGIFTEKGGPAEAGGGWGSGRRERRGGGLQRAWEDGGHRGIDKQI